MPLNCENAIQRHAVKRSLALADRNPLALWLGIAPEYATVKDMAGATRPPR